MKKIIKRMACFGIAAALLTVSAMADFADMPQDAAQKTALLNAVSNGLLNGVGNNEIAPYASITRAQMGAIIVRAFGAARKKNIDSFKDVSKDAWYYDEMSKAVAMGAFAGDGENLHPDSAITFQEAFIVLSRVFDLRYIDEGCLDRFPDKGTVAPWAEDGVKKIVSGGYYSAEKIRANEPISRVEFAVIMNNLVKNYIDEPGTYTSLPTGNTLIRCDGVILDGIVSPDYIIVGDGAVKTKIINADADNIVIRGGDVEISGLFGYVRAIMSGTTITPDTENINIKTYADGSRGVISAEAEGSAINLVREM